MAVFNTWFMQYLLILSLTTVIWSLYDQKRQLIKFWFVLGSRNILKEIFEEWLHLWRRLFQIFWQRSLKSHSSDCSTFLQSTCIPAGWWILHGKKRSSTSIGNCQRILHCNILHRRLRGILMRLLTHVYQNSGKVHHLHCCAVHNTN